MVPCGGAAVWLTMEQVATAALDCRAFPLASSILKQVHDKFPDSLRAARLMVRCPAVTSVQHKDMQRACRV